MAGTKANALNITGDGIVATDLDAFTTSSVSQYGVVVGAANQTLATISTGTSGQVLVSNGNSANPSFQTVSASGITTLDGNTGSATGSTVNIIGLDNSSRSGNTIKFEASGSDVGLKTTDTNSNIIIGEGAGPNISFTGSGNVCLGANALQSIAAGSANLAIGVDTLATLTTGSQNISIGHDSGSLYTSNESSNILLNNTGVVGDQRTLRIGTATGSDPQDLSKAFICGINGNTSSSPALVTINTSTDQLGTTPITASTTWTPVLSFSGGSTGITYTVQSGHYSIFGFLCFFDFSIVLSSKGSSTGTLQFSLPATANNDNGHIVTLFVSSLSLDSTNIQVGLQIPNSGSVATNVYEGGPASASITQMTDNNLSNTSRFYCTGYYYV